MKRYRKIIFTLAMLLLLRLFGSPASAEEAAAKEEAPPLTISEENYLYVNGNNKVFTAAGDMSVLLRLTVETPGKLHILTSGVEISLVLLDETTEEVLGVYQSENGLMDVPFDANPGTYLLGFGGNGEADVRVADEETTARIYAGEDVAEDAGASAPEASEEKTEEEPSEVAEKEPSEDTAEEPQSPAEIPAEELPPESPTSPAPIEIRLERDKTASVLSVLTKRGEPVNVISGYTRESDGYFVGILENGDLLLTPYAYFDSLKLAVTATDYLSADSSEAEREYTLMLSYPDPALTEQTSDEAGQASDAESSDAPAEAAESLAEAVQPAAEADAVPETEQPSEPPVETPEIEEITEPPVEASETEEGTESPTETPETAEGTEPPAETPETEEVTESPSETPETEETSEPPAETPETEENIAPSAEAEQFSEPPADIRVTEEVTEPPAEPEASPASAAEPEALQELTNLAEQLGQAETSEQTEPVEPAEIKEQPEPAETTETTEPSEQSEPAETTEATEVPEPTEPSEPAETAEPSETTEPAEPAETTEPLETTEPAETTEPTELAEPAETTEPTEQAGPEEPAEQPEPQEELPAEPVPAFDPSVPVTYRAVPSETVSVLAILADAGAPVNVITGFTGEMEGYVVSVSQNGDLLLTPYAYFDAITLSVTATDYLAADPAAAEALYTLILSNPDPSLPDPAEEPAEEAEPTEEPAEPSEESAEPSEESAEPSEDNTEDQKPEESAETPDDPLADLSVSIAMERYEDNVIRLYAEDSETGDDENLLYQWQYSTDNEHWFDVPGAGGREYTVRLDETNNNTYWRLLVSQRPMTEESENTEETDRTDITEITEGTELADGLGTP